MFIHFSGMSELEYRVGRFMNCWRWWWHRWTDREGNNKRATEMKSQKKNEREAKTIDCSHRSSHWIDSYIKLNIVFAFRIAIAVVVDLLATVAARVVHTNTNGDYPIYVWNYFINRRPKFIEFYLRTNCAEETIRMAKKVSTEAEQKKKINVNVHCGAECHCAIVLRHIAHCTYYIYIRFATISQLRTVMVDERTVRPSDRTASRNNNAENRMGTVL